MSAAAYTEASAGPACLSDHHWRTLLALADGFAGPTPADSSTSPPVLPSTTPAFTSFLRTALDDSIPDQARTEFRIFLTLIGGVGSYILSAHSGYLYNLTRDEAEEVIKGWQMSRLEPIRKGAKGVGHLVRYIWLRTAPGLLEAMGAPEVPVPHIKEQVGTVTDEAKPVNVLDSAVKGAHGDEGVLVVKTGVLVIGSGSGASAFTHSLVRSLTELGHSPSISRPDILVVERGKAFAPRANGQPLPSTEAKSFNELFADGGLLVSKESGISVVTANTLGGGSRINWSACLQVERKVRQEWTRHMGQGAAKGEGGMFLGAEWQDCLDTYVPV